MQGIGYLSRLFDEMKIFTAEAIAEAYDQSMSTNNIETHLNNIVRETIAPLLNKDMTDLSDEAKKALGSNYTILRNICPNEDPRQMINTLLQAVGLLYGQVVADGLSAKKEEINNSKELSEEEKKQSTFNLNKTYNEKVSCQMNTHCPFLTKELILGQEPEKLSEEEITEKITSLKDSLNEALQTVKKYHAELYVRLGYTVYPKTDKTIMEPNNIYLNLKKIDGSKQECEYSILKPSNEILQGTLAEEIGINREDDLKDSRLETKKVAILRQLVSKNAIPEIDDKLADNIIRLQKAKTVIERQIGKCQTSLEKFALFKEGNGDIPDAYLRQAKLDLEDACNQINETVTENLLHVAQEPHVKKIGEKILNILVNFLTLGMKGYKSEATIQAEKRVALPETLKSITATHLMKERLQEIRTQQPMSSLLNQEEHSDIQEPLDMGLVMSIG
ncbi:hypothetical protein [Legionella sainthelensi]|uniref:hypothetical protein n=2 Tax=Legionella sainthelensi TaxID=28087 RepID=UPI000FE2326D|nr:hypothetical protein [Legionella sainthelensi]